MKLRNNQIVTFTLGSLVFLLFPILSSPDFPNIEFTLANPNGLRETLTHVFMLGFFYLSYFYLIPRFYFRQRYVAFYAWVTVSAIVIFLLLFSLNIKNRHEGPRRNFQVSQPAQQHNGPPRGGMSWGPGGPSGRPHLNILRVVLFDFSLYLFLIVLFASLLLKTNQRWRKLQQEKLETELSYLKAQINPHFLFNTLNSIYSLAIEKSDYTATAVVKLSGMMRYIISESNRNFVSLEKEINYINDYIELQKFRLGGTVNIGYQVKGNYFAREIAPLILITFVENAFKYGVNPEEFSAIDVFVEVKDEVLLLSVENNKVTTNISKSEVSGLGISNARNRLELLYPDRHKLLIRDAGAKFKVYLEINL